MQAPAAEADISSLRRRAEAALAYELDEGYAGFLRLSNGLSWNGFSVYATAITPIAGYHDRFLDGLVEANLQYWEAEPNRPFVGFGQSGDARYVLDRRSMRFAMIDRVTLDEVASFASFDEVIAHLLAQSLA